MDNTSTPNTAKGPNVLMIISSILMVPGIILSSRFIIVWMFYEYLNGPDMVAALITIILLFLEIVFIFLTFLTRLGFLSYEPKKMKTLTKWMLIVNCVQFLFCIICTVFLEARNSAGHFNLYQLLWLVSPPGIIVKILALVGASKSDCRQEENISKRSMSLRIGEEV